MLFRLRSEDFRPEANLSTTRVKPDAPCRTTLNDLTPEDWLALDMAMRDWAATGEPPATRVPALAHYRDQAAAAVQRRLALDPSKPARLPCSLAPMRRLWADRRGGAAVEFAIIGPLFIVMACGILVYGSWFSLAQSVQTLATESARASIGGLDDAERQSLAQAYIDAQSPTAGLDPVRLAQTVTVADGVTRVTLRFDVSDHPVMALKALVPSPPQTIERSAVVLSGAS